MEPILRFDQLTTGYSAGRRQHLVGRNLSAQLQSGVLTAIFGLNGSGKTTLLRTLAGLLAPLSGQLTYGNMPHTEITPKQLARTIAVVLTERPQTGYLRVREIVEMGRMPYTSFSGRISELDRHVVMESMRLTGIEKLSRRLLSSLSDGERQRVMIAKALAQQTPIILLDEPTAFLDFAAKNYLLDLLVRLAHEAHKTILLSTHDVGHVVGCVDQCWLLSRDDLTTGTPAALSADGTLARFLGEDAFQRLAGTTFQPTT